MSDLSNYTLVDLVEGIKNKNFTSEEVTKSFIKNSEVSDKLNTFITKSFDQALVSAKNFDKKSKPNGLLGGIPIAVKDMFCTKDVKTTAGSKILNKDRKSVV